MSRLMKELISHWINADPDNWKQIARRSAFVRRWWKGFGDA